MRRRQRLTTTHIVLILLGVLVVLSIPFLILLSSRLAPKVTAKRNRTICMDHLRQLGAHLRALESRGELRYLTGEAFLLQVAGELPDDQLEIFVCPAHEDPGRPRPGTAEFVKLYRDLDLKSRDLADRTSYAGPDYRNFPPPLPGRVAGRRIWACDRGVDGRPDHDGLCVLWSDGSVEFLGIGDLQGHDPETRAIQLGENSPDPRLRRVRR